jgi:hypothetical protein
VQIDTGACKSVLHKNDYEKYFFKSELRKCGYRLKSVSGERLEILGSVKVWISNVNKALYFVVIDCDNYFHPLLGRNWLKVIFPKWKECFEIKQVNVNHTSQDKLGTECEKNKLIKMVYNKYNKVFEKDRSSHIKNMKASLKLKPGAEPVFHKAYTIPYSKKEEVEKELLNLEKAGIIERVRHSKWASPIVLAQRGDKKMRICVDYKVTLNPALDTEHYPLPIPEDIFTALSGGSVFCVLDLSGAYQQLLLEESAREYMTINTHLGLFRPTRLQFGVSSGPSVFQCAMDQILQGLDNVNCFIDDVVIKGNNLADCYEQLTKVLDRLIAYNVRVNLDKCQFFSKEIKFLGHCISKEGIKPLADKLEAIMRAPAPQSITQLKAYLGLLNYYGKFLPRLSEVLSPLHKLLKSNNKLVWSTECQRAFECSKDLLIKNQLLVLYDCSKELYLTTDASEYGVGAVLSHKIDGEPISFASATLSDSQEGYAQVEKEALGIVFAIQKFHKFLYGRKFTLVTDHQPLKFIFDPLKRIPVTANARLQRWALLLSGYTYNIVYRKGTLLGNADALSRLPLPEEAVVTDTINFLNFSDDIPLDFKEVALYTRTDPTLSKVYEYICSGWPNRVTQEELKPYFVKRSELCVEQKCILWGSRVIIPAKLRAKVLSMFHESHQGIVHSKMLMREYCWWPNLGLDIEKAIHGCDTCQATRSFINTSPLIKWSKTEFNFERVHVDFFYVGTVTYFLIIDPRSKWMDVHIMQSTTASQVIEKLCKTFAIIGIPATLASDNGPPFCSSEFVNFLKVNGCEAVKTPPYHPESNGMAERTVQSIKNSLNRLRKQHPTLSPEVLLQNLLFTYRNSPNSTGMSPNEFLFKQKPRTRFDLLKPHNIVSKRICNGTEKKIMLFKVGDIVWCKNLSQGKGWIKGKVIEKLSEIRYIVEVNGVYKHYHASSLRPCRVEDIEFETEMCSRPELVQENLGNTYGPSDEPVPIDTDPPSGVDRQNEGGEMEPGIQSHHGFDVTEREDIEGCSSPRRSTRVRKAPERLNL